MMTKDFAKQEFLAVRVLAEKLTVEGPAKEEADDAVYQKKVKAARQALAAKFEVQSWDYQEELVGVMKVEDRRTSHEELKKSGWAAIVGPGPPGL